MSMSFRRTAPAAAAVAAIALGGVASPAMARHGADDPAGDDHGVHHVHHVRHGAHRPAITTARATTTAGAAAPTTAPTTPRRRGGR